MAIEAAFTLQRADFPLNAVFEQLTDVTIELDRVVPTGGAVIPYFWISADDTDKLTTDLSEDIGIDQIKVIDKLETQMFVRIDWNLAHESILTAIVNTDITLLSGIGTEDRWTFELRASEQQDLSTFQTYCQNHDIPIELTELHAISLLKSDREYDLTDGQRNALELPIRAATSTRHETQRRPISQRNSGLPARRSHHGYSAVCDASSRVASSLPTSSCATLYKNMLRAQKPPSPPSADSSRHGPLLLDSRKSRDHRVTEPDRIRWRNGLVSGDVRQHP